MAFFINTPKISATLCKNFRLYYIILINSDLEHRSLSIDLITIDIYYYYKKNDKN